MQKKIERENSLLQGKGEEEWITVNGQHIPIKNGQSKDEAVKDSISQKEQEQKKEQVQKLVQTLQSVKKIKLKELVELIKSFQPIDLTIHDKKIFAAFDKYCAEKNVYTRGNSTP